MREKVLAARKQALPKLAVLVALFAATVAIVALAFAGPGGSPSSTCGLGKPAGAPGQNDDLVSGRSSEAKQHGQTCQTTTTVPTSPTSPTSPG
jgi:hypothetical protein